MPEETVQAEVINVAETVTELMDPDKTSELLNTGLDLLMQYGPNLIFALLIFFIGKIIANLVKKMIQKVMAKSHVDPLIIGFTSSIVYMGVIVFIVMAALGQVGIQTTSFIAILGAAGLAIGLALQGSLANFAAGFLLIIFRPLKKAM